MVKNRIVVVVRKGVVEEVIADSPGFAVLVKDLDVEGSDDAAADPEGRPCHYARVEPRTAKVDVLSEFAAGGPA